MLVTNGRIHTLDARGTVVDALLIRDGRVVFAGREAIAECLHTGLTGVHEMGADPQALGDGRVVIAGLELWLDGTLGSRAAARGFQLCVHALADRAHTPALDALERAIAGERRVDHRMRVEHAQILAPAARGRGPGLAAGAAHDARRGRARVHGVERRRRAAGGRAGHARDGQARRPRRAVRGRLRPPTMVGGEVVYAGGP